MFKKSQIERLQLTLVYWWYFLKDGGKLFKIKGKFGDPIFVYENRSLMQPETEDTTCLAAKSIEEIKNAIYNAFGKEIVHL